jgi:hypothetical protein
MPPSNQAAAQLSAPDQSFALEGKLRGAKTKRSMKEPPSPPQPLPPLHPPPPPWWTNHGCIFSARGTDLYESTEPTSTWLRDNWNVSDLEQTQLAPSKFARVEPIATHFGESPSDISVTPFQQMNRGESHSFGWEKSRSNVCVYILFGNPEFHGNPAIVDLQPGQAIFMASIPDSSYSLVGECTYCVYFWPPISARL